MIKKVTMIFAVVAFLVTPSWATVVSLTTTGLGLNSGNYGPYLVVDNVEISAITHVGQSDCGPGTVYLDGLNGLGVQNASRSGSKGISGSGGDQDETLVLDFVTDVTASSIVVGLTDYKAKDDDPVISLILSNGERLIFTESHPRWSSAVTNLGSEKITVSLGVLLGSGFSGTASNVSVSETTGHIYVNSLACELPQIPEPATIALLGLGSVVLFRRSYR